jgi:hypothetical protein
MPGLLTRRRGPVRFNYAVAHMVSEGDESAGKLLHRLLWNMLGTKAGNEPEKLSHLHGRYTCPRSERFHEQLSPFFSNGGRGIRTPERVTPLAVFKTAAFNHSAIPPATKLPDSCCAPQRWHALRSALSIYEQRKRSLEDLR